MVQLEEGEKDVPEIEEDRRSSRSDSGLETPNFLEEVTDQVPHPFIGPTHSLIY